MGRRWSHYIPPEHLVYFGPRAIVSLAAACGFSTRVCRTWTPPILQSIAGLPRPIRDTAAGVYRLAARAGVGPALQYVGVKR
jgi:hypothetical protein